MYVLNLAKDGRILSATFEGYTLDGTIVDTLPDGDISDYKYINGEYVFEPQPRPIKPEPQPESEYVTYQELDRIMKAGVNSI